MNCALCIYLFNFYKNVNKTSKRINFHVFKKQQYGTWHYLCIKLQKPYSLYNFKSED